MLEYGLRFLAGGIAVSAFAALGDVLRPKSFAGLFGAAPSIALATVLITLSQKGAAFAAVEGRSMIVGAFALAAYSWTVCVLLKKFLCPLGLRRWRPWLSGSLLRLVYALSCLDSHDCSVQPFRSARNALVRISRQIWGRRGDDRNRRAHRFSLRADRRRPVSRLSGDLSRKRDVDRKACQGTQGESRSPGNAAWQGSGSARCGRGCTRKFRACAFWPRHLADRHVVSRMGPRLGASFVARRRDACVAGAAMAVED
jgi:hypothetical protein